MRAGGCSPLSLPHAASVSHRQHLPHRWGVRHPGLRGTCWSSQSSHRLRGWSPCRGPPRAPRSHSPARWPGPASGEEGAASAQRECQLWGILTWYCLPCSRNLTAFPGAAKELLLRDLDQLFLSSDCRHFNRTESLRCGRRLLSADLHPLWFMPGKWVPGPSLDC